MQSEDEAVISARLGVARTAPVVAFSDHLVSKQQYGSDLKVSSPFLIGEDNSADNVSFPNSSSSCNTTSVSSSPTSILTASVSSTVISSSTAGSTPTSVPSAGSTPNSCGVDDGNGVSEETTSMDVNCDGGSDGGAGDSSVNKENSDSGLDKQSILNSRDGKSGNDHNCDNSDSSGIDSNTFAVCCNSESSVDLGTAEVKPHDAIDKSNEAADILDQRSSSSSGGINNGSVQFKPITPSSPVTPYESINLSSEEKSPKTLCDSTPTPSTPVDTAGVCSEADTQSLNTRTSSPSVLADAVTAADPENVDSHLKSSCLTLSSEAPLPPNFSEGVDAHSRNSSCNEGMMSDNYLSKSDDSKFQNPQDKHGNPDDYNGWSQQQQQQQCMKDDEREQHQLTESESSGGQDCSASEASPELTKLPSLQSPSMDTYTNSTPPTMKENNGGGGGDGSAPNCGFYPRDTYHNPTPPYPTPPYPTPPYNTMTTVAPGPYSSGSNVYTNSVGYSGVASYPTPSTPSSGYTNPNTPSSSYPNPNTPGSNYQNPNTPSSSCGNPTTPSSNYPNPTTPGSANCYNQSPPTSGFCPSSSSSGNVSSITANLITPNLNLSDQSSPSALSNYSIGSSPVIGSQFNVKTTSQESSASATSYSNSATSQAGCGSHNYVNPLNSCYINSNSNLGNPMTPGSYSNPAHGSNPATPSGNYSNPATPLGCCPNPKTPAGSNSSSGSIHPSASTSSNGNNYPNPSTPGSSNYPHSSTPGLYNYPNPSTPESGNYNSSSLSGSSNNFLNPSTPGSNNYPSSGTPGSTDYPNSGICSMPQSNSYNYTSSHRNEDVTSGSKSESDSRMKSSRNLSNVGANSNLRHYRPNYSEDYESSKYSDPSDNSRQWLDSNTGMPNFGYSSGNSSSSGSRVFSRGGCSPTANTRLTKEAFNRSDDFMDCGSAQFDPVVPFGGKIFDTAKFFESSSSSVDGVYHQKELTEQLSHYANNMTNEKFHGRSSGGGGNQSLEALANMTNSQHHGLDTSNVMSSFINSDMHSSMLANTLGMNMPLGVAPGSIPSNMQLDMHSLSNPLGEQYMPPGKYTNPNTSHMPQYNVPTYLKSGGSSNYDVNSHHMQSHMGNSNMFLKNMMTSSGMKHNMTSSGYDSWMASMNMSESGGSSMLPHHNGNSSSNCNSSANFAPSQSLPNYPIAHASNNGLPYSMASSSGMPGGPPSHYMQQSPPGRGSKPGTPYFGQQNDNSPQHLSSSSCSSGSSSSSSGMARNMHQSHHMSGGMQGHPHHSIAGQYSSMSMPSKSDVMDHHHIPSSSSSTGRSPANPDSIYSNITPDTYYNQAVVYLPEGTSINVEHRRLDCQCILCQNHKKNVNKYGIENVRNHISCVGRGRAGWFTKSNKYRLNMKVSPGLTMPTGLAGGGTASIAESISSTISSVISNAMAQSSDNNTNSNCCNISDHDIHGRTKEGSNVKFEPSYMDVDPLRRNPSSDSNPRGFSNNPDSIEPFEGGVSSHGRPTPVNTENSFSNNNSYSTASNFSTPVHCDSSAMFPSSGVPRLHSHQDKSPAASLDPYCRGINNYSAGNRTCSANNDTSKTSLSNASVSDGNTSAVSSTVAKPICFLPNPPVNASVSSNSCGNATVNPNKSFPFVTANPNYLDASRGSSSNTHGSSASRANDSSVAQEVTSNHSCPATNTSKCNTHDPTSTGTVSNSADSLHSSNSAIFSQETSSFSSIEGFEPVPVSSAAESLLATNLASRTGNLSQATAPLVNQQPLRDELAPSIDNFKTKTVVEAADQLYSFNDSSVESPVPSPIRQKSKKRKVKGTLPVYKSEISMDPQSTGIKLKIKLATPRNTLPKSPSYSYAAYSHKSSPCSNGTSALCSPCHFVAASTATPTLCSAAAASATVQHSSGGAPSYQAVASPSFQWPKKRKGRVSTAAGGAAAKRKRKGSEPCSAMSHPLFPNQLDYKINPTVVLNPICPLKKKKRRSKVAIESSLYTTSDCETLPATSSYSDHGRYGHIQPDESREPQSSWAFQISHEVLLMIFRNVVRVENCVPALLRLSRVCRLWYDVSRDVSLWHTADLTVSCVRPKFRNEQKLYWLLENRLLRVEHLNLTGWNEAVTPLILQRIGYLCSNLVSLNLSSCNKLHGENLAAVLGGCDRLERLYLTDIMGCHKPTPRGAAGQQTLVELFERHNTRLTHLSLAHNTLSGLPVILASLATQCTNLEVLDLSRVETVGRDCLLINLERLQEGCPCLRVLRLSLTKAKFNAATMGQQAASPGFPELEHLYLATDDRQHCGINDSELERILKNSTKLTLLDVRGCMNVSDGSLVRVPPWNIEHLYLSGGSSVKRYSDRLELVVRKWAASLQELDLAWTGDETVVDAALGAAAEDAANLRVLNLCGSSCTVSAVRRVLSNCPDLGQINLSSCRALPRGIKRLYQNHEMITLRRLVEELAE